MKKLLPVICATLLVSSPTFAAGDAEAGKAAGVHGATVYKEVNSPYPHFNNLLEFAKSL